MIKKLPTKDGSGFIQEKVNELVEMSNRQSAAIMELADIIEKAAWVDTYQLILGILNPKK